MNVELINITEVPEGVAGLYLWHLRELNIYYVGMTNNLARRHQEFIGGQYDNQVLQLLPRKYTEYNYRYAVIFTSYYTDDEDYEQREQLHRLEKFAINKVSSAVNVFNMQDISKETEQWFTEHLEELRQREREYNERLMCNFEANKEDIINQHVKEFWNIYKTDKFKEKFIYDGYSDKDVLTRINIKDYKSAIKYLDSINEKIRYHVLERLSKYHFKYTTLNNYIKKYYNDYEQ